MELRHLRYFVAVAEERSFSGAARRLNISQPPLSRQIQDLEADLGVSLFERSTRQVALTSAGRAFLPRARTVLFESRLAADEARRWASGFSEIINIGFMSSVMLSRFDLFLGSYHAAYPEVAIRFLQMRSDEQLAALLDDRIEVGFVDFGIDMIANRLEHARIHSQPFLHEELCAAVPHEHPLAGRSEIALAELKHDTFAILERHLFPAHHDTVIAACRREGFAPRIAHFGDQIPTVLTYVAAGMAVCIAPRLAETAWSHRVAFVSLTSRPYIDISMISRADNVLVGVENLKRIVAESFMPAASARSEGRLSRQAAGD